MPQFTDLTGQKFERLIVIKRVDNYGAGRSQWLCKCCCGNEKIILGQSLKSGATKSCGCLQKEIVTHIHTKHGHAINGKFSKTYAVWNNIIQRCTNPKNRRYHHYGSRGITVCKRWTKFENFLKDMGEPPTQKHSIDRIDNEKGYCKFNCRWATIKEQARNTSRNHLIPFNGKTQCLTEWAEEFDVDNSLFFSRLRRGWSIEKTLTTPARKRVR